MLEMSKNAIYLTSSLQAKRNGRVISWNLRKVSMNFKQSKPSQQKNTDRYLKDTITVNVFKQETFESTNRMFGWLLWVFKTPI